MVRMEVILFFILTITAPTITANTTTATTPTTTATLPPYTTNATTVTPTPTTTTTTTRPPPPSPTEVAKMARYIMHNSDWVSIATISTQSTIQNYPFVSLKSVSDGPDSNSTGIPYLYMTDMDVSGKDLTVNNRCTIMASLAESDYCKQENFDPQDPRCAKLLITGRLLKVDETSSEYNFGLDSLFERHPSMRWWPKDHQFYVAKIYIEQIAVLDYFGGIKHVSTYDYFHAYQIPPQPTKKLFIYEDIMVISTNDMN